MECLIWNPFLFFEYCKMIIHEFSVSIELNGQCIHRGLLVENGFCFRKREREQSILIGCKPIENSYNFSEQNYTILGLGKWSLSQIFPAYIASRFSWIPSFKYNEMMLILLIIYVSVKKKRKEKSLTLKIWQSVSD